MIGSGILTLPWTFYNSGIILGIIICFLSYLASLRTAILVLRITGPGDDFYDTMRKYWGTAGYYIAVIGTLCIIETACTAYFLIMAQMTYPNILALLKWIGDLFGTPLELPLLTGAARFDQFSETYVAIFLYFFMVMICLKRDLSIFIKLSSYGALAIIAISLFIIAIGFYSISNTNYTSITLPT